MSAVAVGSWRKLRRLGRPLARAVRSVRRRRELREALEVIRGVRGARLVLISHRVAPREVPRYEIVPTVPLALFREHLTAVGELGHITSLGNLLNEPDGDERLRFALTFDDDYATHSRYVLPVLREFGLRGTFFLSGRALHGLGAYWFERLEALVSAQGFEATARLLGLTDVREEAQLPLRCEGDVQRQTLIESCAPPGDSPLGRDEIRSLVEAGMEVGFHTLHHPVLPALSDDALCDALTNGRKGLADCVGRSLRWFAYPHGKADARTIRFTREAGYTAAWTTQPLFLRAGDDRYQYGRWDPLPMSTDNMLIRLGQLLRRTYG